MEAAKGMATIFLLCLVLSALLWGSILFTHNMIVNKDATAARTLKLGDSIVYTLYIGTI